MALNFRHAFVITYGRSGSTLLTGILNSIPKTCIRGENGGALVHIFRAIRCARSAPSFLIGAEDSPTHAWYGASSINADGLQDSLVGAFVRNVLAPPDGADLVGFKEIRYLEADLSDLEFSEFLSFLRSSFERPCFIFNVRRHEEVTRSDWWREDPRCAEKLGAAERRFASALQEHEEISYRVNYDAIVKSPERLLGLFDFLGAPFDLTMIQTVMAVPHSAQPTQNSSQDNSPCLDPHRSRAEAMSPS